MYISKDMSTDTLGMVFRDYIRENAERIAQDLLNEILVQSIAENHHSEEDNDGAEIVIRIRVPGTRECDRLVESGEIHSVEMNPE